MDSIIPHYRRPICHHILLISLSLSLSQESKNMVSLTIRHFNQIVFATIIIYSRIISEAKYSNLSLRKQIKVECNGLRELIQAFVNQGSNRVSRPGPNSSHGGLLTSQITFKVQGTLHSNYVLVSFVSCSTNSNQIGLNCIISGLI